MAERMDLNQTRAKRESKKTASPVPPLVGNQYFRVYFGSTLVSFARVSNVQRSVEFENYTEGGLNDYIHVLTKPNSQGGTLTLEKGVSADKSIQKLVRALSPGRRITVPVTITLCHRDDEGWKPVRSWGFEDGMVIRWAVTNLDGMGSELAIEKMEIAHAGLEELEV